VSGERRAARDEWRSGGTGELAVAPLNKWAEDE